ncbi:MAG: hypothetical protein E3K38_06205 [Candidatus Kuenenia stuttgartiensis]|nr:hypothetical protein [Candidatus Kuenenia stuttgartiensis]
MNALRLFIISIFVQWCVPGFIYAEHSTQITGNTIRDRVKDALHYTQHSVDICIYDFASLDIEESLVNAKTRGVRIRVAVIMHGKDISKGLLATALIQKGFDVRVIKSPNKNHGNSIHQDFVILDDRILITGVYNWMAYRNRNIHDYVSFHYNKEKALSYKNTFYTLFTEGDNAANFIVRKEHEEANILPISLPSSLTKDGESLTQKNSGHDGKTKISVTPPTEMENGLTQKKYIDVSFGELNKLFGKESALSGAEKKAQWKEYNGRYIRWNGTVVHKGAGRVDWNRVGISHQGDEEKADVVVVFHWKMYQKVMNISQGDTITYTGKLISRPRLNSQFRIQDGIIE